MSTISPKRLWAMIVKEFLQLFRDKGSMGLIVALPVVQLMLFGYAIDTTPRHLVAVVVMGERTPAARAVLGALEATAFIDVKHEVPDGAAMDEALRSGEAAFGIEIPAGFERAVRRGERPAILIASDASDPAASGAAVAAMAPAMRLALARERLVSDVPAVPEPFELRVHARYNPTGNTAKNIVPGLLGLILTISTLVFTALTVTREVERGTLEALLAMPVTPAEIMLGKIAPYVIVGFIQMAIILVAGVTLFGVPVQGSVVLLCGLAALFIACNLALGYLLSTIAENQLQAIQMSFMMILPSVLLSGFVFPFDGMPFWAQGIGEALPITHFIRITRGIMLKGAGIADVWPEALAVLGLMLVLMTLAALRFRKTLD